ncbi:glycoside hydrolase family 6 protein [Prosthecobacter sp.]|uniref:glycoside hydrolase family 6 protein n=1 Tax=Prosthecobacter sp. TaxID=1965333 RepID=UPI00378441E1
MKTDWHDLIQRHISGLTTEEEDRILEAALKQDDAVARLYLRYMNLDVALEAHAVSLEAVNELLTSSDTSAPVREKRWFSRRPLLAAAAAGLVFVFFVANLWHEAKGPAPLVVESGSTTLDFAHGARVTVHGPARVQRLGPAEMRLLSGRLTVAVPPEGRGFAVETCAGRVVDLGTRFGVLAAGAESVEVHVFEGRVEVTPPEQPAVLLVAGEALVLDAERGVVGRLPADESKIREGTSQPDDGHLDNPFVGANFYRNVEYTAAVNAAADGQTAPLAQQMRRVAEFPTFVWLDSIAAVQGAGSYGRGLAGHLDEALAQNANAIGIVIYDMPNRDGSALASNGELLIAQNGFQRYKAEYIDAIFKILNQPKYAALRVVMVIEPDSLPNLITNLKFPRVAEAQRTGVYVEGVQYAIGTLRSLGNTYAYIDVAHAGWLGWPHNLKPFAELLKRVGKGIPGGNSKVDGLISNTANYNVFAEPYMRPDQKIKGREVRSLRGWYDWNDHIEEQSYANALRDELIKGADAYPATLGLLLDTSRNGWGGPNRPAGPSSSTDLRTFVRESTLDKRTHKGNWGNQSGAGIGARPMANPAPNYDAFVWVKPPGYSDGSSKLIPKGPENPDGKGFDRMCDPSYKGNDLNGHTRTNALPDAPAAGRWFQAQFEELVRNAYPPFAP